MLSLQEAWKKIFHHTSTPLIIFYSRKRNSVSISSLKPFTRSTFDAGSLGTWGWKSRKSGSKRRWKANLLEAFRLFPLLPLPIHDIHDGEGTKSSEGVSWPSSKHQDVELRAMQEEMENRPWLRPSSAISTYENTLLAVGCTRRPAHRVLWNAASWLGRETLDPSSEVLSLTSCTYQPSSASKLEPQGRCSNGRKDTPLA